MQILQFWLRALVLSGSLGSHMCPTSRVAAKVEPQLAYAEFPLYKKVLLHLNKVKLLLIEDPLSGRHMSETAEASPSRLFRWHCLREKQVCMEGCNMLHVKVKQLPPRG
ncbi:hypothetical protein AAHA92_32774 [Salvia divinorum]|uniref:Secreted protein n=1 Tax=Salvia divinorum TaxID=28513 RepID=A0ABD1FP11_SALDI